MVKKVTTLIMLILFFIGLSVLLYPSISTYWNSKTQSKVVENYENIIQGLDKEATRKIFEDAYNYNDKLAEITFPLKDHYQVPNYYETLNLNGGGMMGYISIPSIGVEIPIYHGTGDDILAFAAGHMTGTSLPVGGESTHSVLSAHRGLPNAKLFTDLNKVNIGDYFTITVLDRVITYEVDQILTVKPENITEISIIDGEDHCTLITCTPYGINTHRLLVRGARVDKVTRKNTYIGNEAYQIDTLVVTPIVALPMIFILILIVVFQPVKEEKLIEGDEFNEKEKSD